MLPWVVWAVFTAGGLLLLAAGVGHVLRRRHLAAVLKTHRLPTRVLRPVAALLGFAELVVGAAMTTTAATGTTGAVAGILGALVYGAFALYLLRVLRVAPGADCGCFGGDEPASGWTVARALLLAGAGVLAAVLPCPVSTPGQGGVLLAAAVVVALLLATVTSVWSLVAASQPS